ncbi:MAG: hypothetical protein GY754_47290 [bacterium]|nr:hypothetical protein [bacterium]
MEPEKIESLKNFLNNYLVNQFYRSLAIENWRATDFDEGPHRIIENFDNFLSLIAGENVDTNAIDNAFNDLNKGVIDNYNKYIKSLFKKFLKQNNLEIQDDTIEGKYDELKSILSDDHIELLAIEKLRELEEELLEVKNE